MPNIPAKYHTTLVAWGAGLGVSFILTLMFVGVPQLGKLAWAEDTAKQIEQVYTKLEEATELSKENASETVTQSIFSATKEKCVAQEESRSVSFWTERLIKLRAKYKELTEEEFPQIDCKDL
jgi:hypothetical protein